MRSPLNPALRRFLCLVILTAHLCLWPTLFPLTGTVAVQASDIAQQVQQGIEAYRQYRYTDAIQIWATVLEDYPAGQPGSDQAIVLENLALARQQQGDFTLALENWQAATAIHTAQQNWREVGRLLTAQAQTYNRLGQPFQAISLLCKPFDSPIANDESADSVSCLPGSALAMTEQSGTLAAQVVTWGSLGETYRTLQDYDAALASLQQGLRIADTLRNPYYQALLHQSLGNVHRENATLNYQQAVASLRSASGDAAVFSTGVTQARGQALQHFTNSRILAQAAQEPALITKAILGLIAVHSQAENQTEVVSHLQREAIAQLAKLPPTQETAYLALQLAKQRPPLINADGKILISDRFQSSRSTCRDIRRTPATLALLEQALNIAESLGHNRLKAFAQGEIGHFYECDQQYSEALEWTQKARLAATGDRVLALDTLYLWQWQAGRIYRTLEAFEAATDFYRQATRTLNQIRDEILASNQTLQFDFRDAVAPVYRELAEIQLAAIPASATTVATELAPWPKKADVELPTHGLQAKAPIREPQAHPIREALVTIDDLQLAELQNYFGSDCLVPVASGQLDQRLSRSPEADGISDEAPAALISTIIFPDKTALVLTLPQQPPQLYWVAVPEAVLHQTVIRFRNSLEDTTLDLEGYDTQLAQTLYQWLMAPLQPELVRNGISTLVFVHDGILRNIPMAALHDGQQYLVERYAIAIAPSLQQETITLPASAPQALVLGLSQNPVVNGQALGPLPAVKREVQTVVNLLPGSDLLLNQGLTQANLQQQFQAQAYSVLHIATHGKFGTDPDTTFLVMGDKESASSAERLAAENPSDAAATLNNKLLRLGELDTLIRQGAPRESGLDLIVLSACQTASGDERSTLGLAGVTIRAGANSAVASLWSVSDAATADLMTAFYRNWTQGQSKAAALQAAQRSVMADPQYLQHPAYWAAFALVGDWG